MGQKGRFFSIIRKVFLLENNHFLHFENLSFKFSNLPLLPQNREYINKWN